MLSNQDQLEKALCLLGGLLDLRRAETVNLVVCGGAALLARGLRVKATQDVDVLAVMDDRGRLAAPVPLPKGLVQAAAEAAKTLDLPPDWINNGPSSNERGLYQMGLPEGLERRLSRRQYGRCLNVFFISRLDQIHFKLHAAAQAGGRHTEDLLTLSPSETELSQAAQWALARYVRDDSKDTLKKFLVYLGYGAIAERL